MRFIVVTRECYDLIRSKARYEFIETGISRDDGRIDVPVDEDVFRFFSERQWVGESLSDTIIRLVSSLQ